ncbi:MAG TPA: methyltransferase [Erysipelotrichaceae bacterium]|nr:methyltransferase [Erysipelotrichaceae bacterium]
MKGCGFTAHYFTDNRNLSENRKEHSFRFSGHVFTFVTDNGVFSKGGVDSGTEILLEACAKEDIHGNVLDLGCGYGVVGTVIKTLFPACRVISTDVNPRAAELAEINSRANRAPCEVYVSDGFEKIEDVFDSVITNPPIRAGKAVIYRMFEDAFTHMRRGGSLYAVIRRKQGAESALRKLEEIFQNCDVISRDKGYWVLKSTKLTD